jgi:DMSO/TMAO reductase YedYZ molybdopterin-dependent catalytic subunit
MPHLAPRRTRRLASLLAVATGALLALAPLRAADSPALTVSGGGQTLTYSLADFAALPHLEVTALDPHAKEQHTYSGVLVHDLLAKVGMPGGDALRGALLRQAVIVHASDGYATLFALAEFDENFSDRTILLADRQDGRPLPPNAGPLRLIVPHDKRAARWARMVQALEIVSIAGKTP